MLTKFLRSVSGIKSSSSTFRRQSFATINSIAEFYRDNKMALLENPRNFNEFSFLAKQFVFTFSICSNPINELREYQSSLIPYLKKGIRTLNQNVCHEDVALITGIFHIFLKAKENNIDCDAKQCFLNYYSGNFHGELAPFLRFINWLSNLTKLSDPRVAGEFIHICHDSSRILNTEKSSLTPLHKIQLSAFMLNFELNDEQLLTVDSSVNEAAKVA